MNRDYRIKNEYRPCLWAPDGWDTYVLQVRVLWMWFSLARFSRKEDAINVLNSLI